MLKTQDFSARSVYEALLKTFHQYLRAQYHIWDESLIAERDRLFDSLGITHQEARIESTPLYSAGTRYSELNIPAAARRILEEASNGANTGIPRIPYSHQAEAIESFLANSADVIVATGTGSGKTESFLMPILSQLAIEASTRPRSWMQPGVRALLLYPMNALVNDQLSRLRRLFGDENVAKLLVGSRKHRATFGVYTGRTPYAGPRTKEKDKIRIEAMLARLYFANMKASDKETLLKEGKWPVKDLKQFVESGFQTADVDSELLTRHEMQERSPDVLVTNYSMLEYMMLRPIEAGIFDQTKRWLEHDDKNRFVVVIDEAHMYRGSAGAEVAYLLRRLHSRLGVGRDRVRYILTSASLGTSEEAKKSITRFASKLTGASEDANAFELIMGKLEQRPTGGPAAPAVQIALAKFDYNSLHQTHLDLDRAVDQVQTLCRAVGLASQPISNVDELRALTHDMLFAMPVAHHVSRLITGHPTALSALADSAFPQEDNRPHALESLLALMAFARQTGTGKPFAPIRSHFFFRGIPGLFVCTNSACSDGVKGSSSGAILGRVFASPRLRCSCGARVYELLTHRDCGAAYLRGYINGEAGTFIWHEPSSGIWSDGALIEAHFFVVGDSDDIDLPKVPLLWLVTKTGQLVNQRPAQANEGDYLRVARPLKAVTDQGRRILDIFSDCPACTRNVQSGPKAMDLATKGEAPFAHIVRAQVSTQPRTSLDFKRSPNGGRKNLIFSDGRQKAARLARDIPREIELDVFRQLLVVAAQSLVDIAKEPRLDGWIYTAVLGALSRTGLQLFDGDDRNTLVRDVEQLERYFDGDIAEALDQFSSPPRRFSALLLKQLCSRHYSISALTLGYVLPAKSAMKAIVKEFPGVSEADLHPLVVSWIHRLLEYYAFDRGVSFGIRREAAQYPVDIRAAIDGFTKRQREFLQRRGVAVEKLVDTMSLCLGEQVENGGFYLNPKRLKLEVAVGSKWFQCGNCKSILPVSWWDRCTNCLKEGIKETTADATSYLRARKGFWRDPVAGALNGTTELINLSVEEHTAQLSFKDVDEPTTTTEEFERRFRDILIWPSDTSIDVLSCTTTMEVGIDIGSLVAVAMRNVPPMRQNYQQRAGRAGRRGTSISTVVTYAQNGAHDSYYFCNPDKIISGDPPRPILDTDNVRIITRHVRAQFVQDFFRPRAAVQKSGDVFSVLGDTWTFYAGAGPTSLKAFGAWLEESDEAKESFRRIADWLPSRFPFEPSRAAREFIGAIESVRPVREQGIEKQLIEYFFSKGLLPSYAFPRDLCALQIERIERGARGTQVKTEERPQQSLNVALSEYAPGRLVVVNKKTYRIGTVAANSVSTEVDRSKQLFEEARFYVHCEECHFTAGFAVEPSAQERCPQCGSSSMTSVTVIRPEVVFPRGGDAIDEFDDDQQFSRSTGAQLPLADSSKPLESRMFGEAGQLAFQRLQPLVVVNKGPQKIDSEDGFRVCDSCGRVLLEGESDAPHKRDYHVQYLPGRTVPKLCNGTFRRVYLGFGFTSDVLLLRLQITSPLRFDHTRRRQRKPLEDALQSLAEAIVLAMSRILDIDVREISAGFRFASSNDQTFADVFVYDTLSGGAGYAYAAGERFSEIFEEAERLLQDCVCDRACENCLKHFGNRFYEQNLDRKLGRDLARYIRTGQPPPHMTLQEQRRHLEPLGEMLKLAGWTISVDTQAPMHASLNDRVVELFVCPSLLEGDRAKKGTALYTPYELSRDLASVYSELA